MATQSEAALESKLINKLADGGYQRVQINDETELKSNFKAQLEKFNHIQLTDKEFNQILIHLEGGTVFDKAKKLRDRYELKRESGPVKYISFLNKKDWCKNIFQVTNQVTLRKKYENRYDVTILINGLPLVQIELKKRGVELKRAFNQINRYHRHSFKGLFNYVQIFVISNGVNTKYYANNKDLSFKYSFYWKDKDNHNISNLDEFADIFLEKCHLSKMIARYIVLNETDKALMVLRAYQYYAVEAILDKALNTKQNGYVWHTTGSGKTLTSFKVSQILEGEEGVDKIIFVVDRKDLDYQTTKEFNSFCDGAVDGTDNTKSLLKQLSGSNKLIITTIQKLTRAVDRHDIKLKDVKDKKIILMFDECHRSQFGEMHKKITGFFTNLQYFGFTGTPIFAVNSNKKRTTRDIFGEKLHTYVIKDAIHDQNVLGFCVEYLGTYKNKAVIDIEVEDIDRKEVMESDLRLEKIVEYIINNHDKKTYNREFNAIFAVSSVNVLKKYYDLFKSKDHDLKIATIFSYDDNEEIKGEKHSREKLDEYIKDYNELFGTNFSTETFDQYYVDVAKRSKDKQIDILIVVNMFLTGFDNKFLNTLYVDKNLKYHTLVQAYSRTNRLLNEKKKQGNIVCFRNLKKFTDDAIRLYSDEDAAEVVLMKTYDEYVKDFNEVLVQLFELTPDVYDVDELPSEVEKKLFVQIFRELLRLITRLYIFTEFDFEDLDIPEQAFEDFKSKYLDIYEEVNTPTGVEKTSVLDDIDFEIELIRRDDINVTYILTLLKELDYNSPSFEKDKEFIIGTMEKSRELRSKVQLIEQFIDNNIPQIENKDHIEENFEIFLEKEKEKAIDTLIKEEKLNDDLARDIISEYEFSGKMQNNLIKESFSDIMGLKERRSKLKTIKEYIMNLVDKFSW
ncbi:type I restriction endonuclease subunit R [Methanobacterium alkalithermotolerans]|uniref:type I site-specific deoxyribonuclease n=1 Tax=Methanobacterium alkalithermotolerans TaxID=2731220 RepID=A0A8T8KBQ4_9EURY|nr:type I restriction endonuclease subunit R [Methanobacterium alkalithermotolerans]QUH24210.1 type I restriction endonuclease subunit R [Methanobacterium alkalithermotolerans]